MIVTVCSTEEETAALLATVLDGDHTAASLLAKAIHQDPATVEANTDGLTVSLSPSELGIWIDPIGEELTAYHNPSQQSSSFMSELSLSLLCFFFFFLNNLDATSQYIQGREEELEEGRLSPSGLHCALVLIGVYLRSTGEPIMGVINQPFHHKDPAGGG